jgi:hypothetical protein
MNTNEKPKGAKLDSQGPTPQAVENYKLEFKKKYGVLPDQGEIALMVQMYPHFSKTFPK